MKKVCDVKLLANYHRLHHGIKSENCGFCEKSLARSDEVSNLVLQNVFKPLNMFKLNIINQKVEISCYNIKFIEKESRYNGFNQVFVIRKIWNCENAKGLSIGDVC